jgi:2-hydroxychromene-2-carboxylate isomerase/catechol 2,3-dioxygenase-like lactoylglutathione lyase family enzyme
MKTLAFYFDFISPYAYLAWTQVHAVAARHGCEVEPRPLLFAALLDANGQRGPAEIPRKRLYTFKDVVRSAHRLGVPLGAPATHPFNPLLALRVASAELEAKARTALVDALFEATWVKGLDVTREDVVVAAADSGGLDGASLVLWAKSPEAKERVKKTTAEALELGAFGVPTMVAGGELFWGLDSLANLDRFLDGEDPLSGGQGAAFARVAPSATRPRAAPHESPAEGAARVARDVIVRTEAPLDAAARFYEAVLGFRPTMKRGDMLGFETGAVQLFVEKGAPHGAVFDVRARDPKATKAALLAAGCRVIEEDARVPRCYLADPYGLVFNLEGA